MDYLDEGYLHAELKEDDGIGHRPEKHAAPMLRLFTAEGNPWLCWGGVLGGEQGDGWFELYYHGMVRREDGVKFGHFVVRVEGEGLEPLCHQMARHGRPSLRVGRTVHNQQPIEVRSITVEPLEVEEI